MTDKPLVNRVANSGLQTINLENFYPEQAIKIIDIKDFLFQGLILKEKDFRTQLKEKDWSEYENTHVCLVCTADAIVPLWANMLIVSYLNPIVASVFVGDKDAFLSYWFERQIEKINPQDYLDQRVVIKGCSNKPVPASAYASLTNLLIPEVQSIMFGEPCSTVPVFKRPRKINKN